MQTKAARRSAIGMALSKIPVPSVGLLVPVPSGDSLSRLYNEHIVPTATAAGNFISDNSTPFMAGGAALGGALGGYGLHRLLRNKYQQPTPEITEEDEEDDRLKTAEDKLGPHAATYAAAARGLDAFEPAGRQAHRAYRDAGMPLRAAGGYTMAAVAPLTQRSMAVQAVNPYFRWGSDLIDGLAGGIINVGAGLSGGQDKVDKATGLYDKLISKYRDEPNNIQPASEEYYNKAVNTTPRTLYGAAYTKYYDDSVAAHRRNRKEYPINYFLNPLVNSGPLSEAGARLNRRSWALFANPEARARPTLYLPMVQQLRALFSQSNHEDRAKARGLAEAIIRKGAPGKDKDKDDSKKDDKKS